MRIVSKGNWNVCGTNNENGKVIYPFYDGFNTKVDASLMRHNLAQVDKKHIYRVIKNK